MATLTCPTCRTPFQQGDLICLTCGANLARVRGAARGDEPARPAQQPQQPAPVPPAPVPPAPQQQYQPAQPYPPQAEPYAPTGPAGQPSYEPQPPVYEPQPVPQPHYEQPQYEPQPLPPYEPQPQAPAPQPQYEQPPAPQPYDLPGAPQQPPPPQQPSYEPPPLHYEPPAQYDAPPAHYEPQQQPPAAPVYGGQPGGQNFYQPPPPNEPTFDPPGAPPAVPFDQPYGQGFGDPAPRVGPPMAPRPAREETLLPPEGGRNQPLVAESTAAMCPYCEAVLTNPAAAQCDNCLRPLGRQQPPPLQQPPAPQAPPILRLQFPTGELQLQPGQHLVLGRDAGQSPVAGTFTQYDNVSRRHTTVWLDQAGTAWARDERSTNGTFVNGERLPAGVEAPLRDGDTLRLAADVTGTVRLT